MKMVFLDSKVFSSINCNFEKLKKYGELTIVEKASNQDVLDLIKDAEAVFSSTITFDKETISECKNLKYLGSLSVGYDRYDLKELKRRGVALTNSRGYGNQTVSQHAFALLLSICNGVDSQSGKIREGKWYESFLNTTYVNPAYELYGKTLGIIGFGNIGQCTGRIANGFGMNVIYCDNRDTEVDYPAKKVSNEEMYMTSDVIVLHCPLTDETKHMINKETLEMMKDNVILINVARGGLINEDDLANALKTGKVFGAGLDVTEKEPYPSDGMLANINNCIITPHIAWVTQEAKQRMFDTVISNFESYINGGCLNRII